MSTIPLVVTAPNSCLSTHCYSLPPVWERPRASIHKELKDFLEANPGAAGVAAPQLALPDRAFAVRLSSGDILVAFNPLVVPAGYTKAAASEECLSLPGQHFLVDRYRHVYLAAESVDGLSIRQSFADRDARVVQHEVDHLNGLLISRFPPADV